MEEGKLIRKLGSQEVLKRQEQDGVVYLTFPALSKFEAVRHLFTTRLGGASEGIYGTMNLSYTRGDEKAAVDENYRRIAKLLGCRPEDFVCSEQTHTANIRVVTDTDRGKGVTSRKDYRDVDGLVTDIPGIALATFYADCVPVYFVDPVRKVIGLAHSGWKGTVQKISAGMICLMERHYGCRAENITAAIGPSICQDCYEISEDVAEEVKQAFDRTHWEKLLKAGRSAGKYQLSLWNAIYCTLSEGGIRKENISVTDICTCCNPELLFSHRASGGKRGNLGAFLMLAEERG